MHQKRENSRIISHPRATTTTVLIAGLFLALLSSVDVAASKVDWPYGGPATNPHLAQTYNNQGHWNDAGTDSTDIAIPRGHFRITEGSYDFIASDAMGIPFYASEIDARDIRYFWTGFQMLKLERLPQGGYREIDRVGIDPGFSDFQVLNLDQRLQQAAEIEALLRQGDEQALADYLATQPNRLLSAIEDQVSRGVLYSLFAKNDVFIAANARGLLRIEQENSLDPESKMLPIQTLALPLELFDDQRAAANTFFPADTVFGMAMTFNGVLVINTVSGRLITLDPQTLEILDSLLLSEGEVISNSIASSEELNGRAIYVASNRAMYRFVVEADGRIHRDAQVGGWRAAYSEGRRFDYGKIGTGTGATPTLMGFGEDEDKLVVITDGADKMGLVAFWRDQIPEDARPLPQQDPRVADVFVVDFGDDISQSEQSVVTAGPYAFVVSSVPQRKADPLPARGAYLRGLLTGVTREPVMGIAMYQWDSEKNRWQSSWQRTDVGSLATVPMLSIPTRQVIINGYFQDRLGESYHLGFDIDSGDVVMSIAAGINPLFNGTFTGLKCDPTGNIWYTMMFGLVTLDTSKMLPVANPDPRRQTSKLTVEAPRGQSSAER